MEKENYIFGIHPIKEAIASGKALEKVFFQKGIKNPALNELFAHCREKGINTQFVPEIKLKKLVKGNHQGVVAYISAIETFSLEEEFENFTGNLILVLDEVSDVRNFGAICRTAECAGVSLIVVPKTGSAQLNGDAVKTSAGALNRIKICKEDSLTDSVDFLKHHGFKIVAATEKATETIHETDFKGKCVIVMGSEGKGVSKDILNLSDVKTKIPMQGKTSSLNVSVATGIILFEALRQNG